MAASTASCWLALFITWACLSQPLSAGAGEHQSRKRALLQADTLASERVRQTRWEGWLTPQRELDYGWLMRGDQSRLRAALDRYHKGDNLTIATIGASITAGQGKNDGFSWPEWLAIWALHHYNSTSTGTTTGRVRVLNGGVPGITSQYMSLCVNIHAPKDIDIAVVDFSVNDVQPLPHPKGTYHSSLRRAFERLLRQLLNYPRRPAVVLLNAFKWFHADVPNGTYWTGADRHLLEFASYYHLPVLSIKACCWQLMAQGYKGFNVTRPRATHHGVPELDVDIQYRHDMYYWDRVHPNGWTGHKVMAELVANMLATVDKERQGSASEPQQSQTDTHLSAIPAPMIPGNYESVGDRCLVEGALRAAVLPSESSPPAASEPAFIWVNDRPEGFLAKWGWVATQPGAVLRLMIDTRIAAAIHQTTLGQPATPLPTNPNDTRRTMVGLGFLTSYQNVGIATVSCESGCSCNASRVDLLRPTVRVSLTAVFELVVTQSEKCVIAITAVHRNGSIAGDAAGDGSQTQTQGGATADGTGQGQAGNTVITASQGHTIVTASQGSQKSNKGEKVKLSSVMVSDEEPGLVRDTLTNFIGMDWVIYTARPKRII